MKKILYYVVFFMTMLSCKAHAEEYIIYDTQSDFYYQNGQFEESEYFGFGDDLLMCTSNGEQQWDITIEEHTGVYRVYYYFNPLPDGDRKVKITCSTYVNSFSRYDDFSQGVLGWREIGVFNFMDYASNGKLYITFSGSGEGKYGVSAVKIVKEDESELPFYEFFVKEAENAMILKADNNIVYYNMEKLFIQDAYPIIKNNRTLVPLRFIAETMGAEVDWDSEKKQALINIGDKNIVFQIDSKNFTVDRDVYESDTEAQIINDRTYIPLRALSECLDKQVEWDEERKLIFIADRFEISAFINEDTLDKIESKFNE